MSQNKKQSKVQGSVSRSNTGHWAEFWRVTVRTVQRWARQGLPYDQPKAMAHMILGQTKAAAGAREKAAEILLESRESAAGIKSEDSQAGVESADGIGGDGAEGIGFDSEKGEAPDLYGLRSYYWRRLRGCADAGDTAGLDFWDRKMVAVSRAIRDQEAHAKKLGLDEGEIIAKADFERVVWALAYRAMRGVDLDIKSLCPHLVKLDFPEEVESVLDRFFVRKRIVEPFSKAWRETGVELPEWVGAAFREAVESFCDGGADAQADD